MTRFVELPIVSDRGSRVWINPDHVVTVEAHVTPGSCWVVSEQGYRTHIALTQEGVVECLEAEPNPALMKALMRVPAVLAEGPYLHEVDDDDQDVDVRDSVRENLTR